MAERYRTLERDRYDVIVVGAGIGALTAAALLARRGRSVLVLDQHYVAGGNATVFRRRSFEFDIGVHYLGDCGPDGPIPRMLRAAGVEDVRFRPLDPDGFDTLVFPDRTFRVPASLDEFRTRLLAVSPREGRGVDGYLRFLREVDALAPHAIRSSALGILATLPRARFAARHAFRTLGELFAALELGPALRAVIAGQSLDYGLPPSRVSAVYHALMTLHYFRGAYYPEGGGQVLADRLSAEIEEHGGKILLISSVKRILVEGGSAAGVELENRHLGTRIVRAPVVISNADLKKTLLELVGPEHLRARTVAWARGLVMPPALAVLYVGAARDLAASAVPNTNFFWFPDDDVEAHYREVEQGRPGSCGWVTIASLKDPANARIAPAGHANFQVVTVVPDDPRAWGLAGTEGGRGERPGADYRRSAGYLAAKERVTKHLLAIASRIFPGIEKDVVETETATPLTHARYTRSTGGTGYGIAVVPAQMLHRRPGAKTEIRGLFLCGASQRFGHGIQGSMMNGLMAAAAVSGRRLVAEVLGR